MTQSIVVGTAGHIDHGKSALVKALTGTDPDRLKEEKARGITIDLGFAHLRVGDVDARVRRRAGPRALRAQHARRRGRHRRRAAGRRRRRVRDAADARALRHLPAARHRARRRRADASRDLADADMLELAALEVRELVAGSFLDGRADRPGVGADRRGARRTAVRAGRARGAARQARDGVVRLPVDRVFTSRVRHGRHRHARLRASSRATPSSICCRRADAFEFAASRCTASRSIACARRSASP